MDVRVRSRICPHQVVEVLIGLQQFADVCLQTAMLKAAARSLNPEHPLRSNIIRARTTVNMFGQVSMLWSGPQLLGPSPRRMNCASGHVLRSASRIAMVLCQTSYVA